MFDVFGPVTKPFYSVRYLPNLKPEDLPTKASVFYVPDYVTYVDPKQISSHFIAHRNTLIYRRYIPRAMMLVTTVTRKLVQTYAFDDFIALSNWMLGGGILG